MLATTILLGLAVQLDIQMLARECVPRPFYGQVWRRYVVLLSGHIEPIGRVRCVSQILGRRRLKISLLQQGAVQASFTKQLIEILKLQIAGPHRSIAATRIVEVFGYSCFNRGNMDYGLIAAKDVNKLDFDTETNDVDDRKFRRVLAIGDGSTIPHVWYTRPELAEALVICNIVSRDDDGACEFADVEFPEDVFAYEGKKQLRLHPTRERL